MHRQLKSTDLTIDFSDEEHACIKKGSAIDYIQREEESEDVKIEDGFRIRIVQNAAREIGETIMRVLWCNSAYQHFLHKEKHRRYRKGTSRMQKHTDEAKKLKRTVLNKNSIKMAHLTDI